MGYFLSAHEEINFKESLYMNSTIPEFNAFSCIQRATIFWFHLKHASHILAIFAWLVLFRFAASGQQTANLYSTTWAANTYANGLNHVQQNIFDIAVAPDGTVFTDVVWDEGDYECTQFNPDGTINKPATYTHGWGPYGGMAVACNSNYVFLAQGMQYVSSSYYDTNSWPAPNCYWYGLSRRQRSNIQLGAPFAGGQVSASNSFMMPAQSYLIVNNATNNAIEPVTGLAANNYRLYIASAYNGTISIYNLISTNMVPAGIWSMPRVFRLALDSNGNAWVIQRGDSTHTPVVWEIDSNGNYLGSPITFASGVNPVSIVCDGTNYLLIADNGPDQNIKFYSTTNLTGSPTHIVQMLGTNLMNGSGTNVGRIGPARFYGPTSVGVDTNHDVYVSWNYDGPPDGITQAESLTGSQGILEKYDSSGNLLWSRQGLNFVDCAAMDPASPNDFYSAYNHYTMNWSNVAPGSQWSFTGVDYNRFLYPFDPRPWEGQEFQPVLRRLNNGQLYMYSCAGMSEVFAVFRFNHQTEGETAIPCTFFCKDSSYNGITNLPSGESIWYDKNGNGQIEANEFLQPAGAANLGDNTWGWWVDTGGNVWETVNGGGSLSGLRRYRIQGFDTNQTPIYSYTNMDVYAIPAPFLNQTDNGLERVLYDQTNDIMYLGGYSAQYPSSTWGVFQILARYNNWSTGNRTAAWVLPLPYNTSTSVLPFSFDVAGSFIFVGGGSTRSQISVYRTSDASFVGYLTPNGQFNSSQTGWIDVRPFGVHAYLLTNNCYLISLEDDGWNKTIFYLWNPSWPLKPSLGNVNKAGSSVAVNVAAGSVGSNYEVQTSTNLINWAPLFSTNWPSFPSQFMDGAAIASAKFYRVVSAP